MELKPELRDRFGRQIIYLRISVTDRCNFRCVYCMPDEGVMLHHHQDIMRYEEIAEVVRVAAEHGVRAVRLTGGEPLVRKDLPTLVDRIAHTPGITDVSLTTNGMLLEELASPLAAAGLNRVNVSMDTIQPEKFHHITRYGSFEKVWRGILAAEANGLKPIKINAVVMRGVNDDELTDLAKLSMVHPWHIRFIELMPVNNQVPWGPDFPDPNKAYFSVQEMKKVLEPLGLEPTVPDVGYGPAREFRLKGGIGSVGFISPLGEHFCHECNRLRLTADGNLRPCLLSDIEISLLAGMRAGEPVFPYLEKALHLKPFGHELSENHLPHQRCMLEIGG